MNPNEELQRGLAGLYRLARLQHGVRLGLRALWLGVGGAILGWSLFKLFGLLPDPADWAVLGLAFALGPLAAIAAAFLPRSRWVWRLDRRLGLQEQVSTAWEVSRTGQVEGLPGLLVQDVIAILPRIRRRMLQRGWFLSPDLLSTAIVLLLAAILIGTGMLQPLAGMLGDGPAAFSPPPPPLESLQQPPVELPGGLNEAPGGSQEGAGTEGAGEGEEGQEGAPGAGEGAQPGAGTLDEILRGLGAELSDQAGTYDLGQALENLDLEGAAEAAEDLAGRLGELSPESRDNLAEALEDAAEQLQQAGEPSLPQDMAGAADALQDGSDRQAGEALGEVAGDLRDLAGTQSDAGTAGGGSAGDGSGGNPGSPEPLARLFGEGEDLELPLSDPSESGLLNPSPPGAAGAETLGGAQDSTYLPGSDAAQVPLLPGSFLWKWRDVVSQYFQR